MFETQYMRQLRLLLPCLPVVARHECFALKGGTAINFFVRDMPRISVDIDLAYLRINNREQALAEIETALAGVAESILSEVSDARVSPVRTEGVITKLIVSRRGISVIIEVNTIIRGAVFPVEMRDLCAPAQERLEMFVAASTLSIADLYGGKICAALDRQHPRDLFDMKNLIETSGITEEIRKSFIVYLASHSRPMNELLNPVFKDIASLFENQFMGMAVKEVEIDELIAVQHDLPTRITSEMNADEKHFLLSFKQGNPEWDILGIPGLQRLPALRWKIMNIEKMSSNKRNIAFEKLKRSLDT